MKEYILLVLHKLEHTFGYYDVESGEQIHTLATRKYPHEICLDPERRKVYIAEMGVRGIESEGPGGNTIAVFDLKRKEQIDTIDTGEYDRPHGIATFRNRIFVTSESTRHLLVFDLATKSLLSAIHLDQECAHMVGISPDGRMAFTANIGSNSVSAVDTSTFEVLGHIPVPERPEGMVFSPDGRWMYCVCREAGMVAVIDCEKLVMVDRILTGHGPVRVVISPDGKRLAVPLFHSSSMEVVETETLSVIKTIPVGPHPAGTCMSPDGKLVFISCEDENLVYTIDMETLEIVSRIPTGNGADAMVCLFTSEIELN